MSNNGHDTYVKGKDNIEAVIQTIDEGLERLPSYMDLYFKWERQQWSTQEIDFRIDQQQWAAESEQAHRNRMGLYVAFYAGEMTVADTLTPYIAAMPRLDQRVFLTTQVVDEARHVVFFDKWFREVLGQDRAIIGDQMKEAQGQIGPYYDYIFYDLLPRLSADIAKHPEDMGLLVEGVTLYHIFIEGALALGNQTRTLQNYKTWGIFPGFQEGFTNVARDESRHVLFGVKFLYDMVQADNRYAYRIIDFINPLLSGLYDFGRPAPEAIPWFLKNGMDVDWMPKFYANALRRKLRAIGIQAHIPEPTPTPIPPEAIAAAQATA
jgi:ribonucleoside-diphosphate reductase beta chain